MNYETAKKLKDAGFPQKGLYENTTCRLDDIKEVGVRIGDVYVPTLNELIEACGEDFLRLEQVEVGWIARPKPEPKDSLVINRLSVLSSTPCKAVALLWLKLNKK